MRILGISFFYHDASACLLEDGIPVAMADEERFSRKKHDSDFPKNAIEFVLRQANITAQEVDWVVFYEKPFIKFDRIIKTSLATFPWAPQVFAESLKHLFLDKLWIRQLIADELKIAPKKVLFSNHHLSHGASAFFCSPWERAAILTVDGVGEWATATLGIGENNTIRILKEIHFPHSLGLLYSAVTAFLGFEVNEGEYKVMGMAPYGKPRFVSEIRKLLEQFPDGSFALDLKYFRFHRSLTNTYSKEFIKLFGTPRDPKSKFFTRDTGWPPYFGPQPEPEEYERKAIEQERYADLAASVQVVLEEFLQKLVAHLHELTGEDRLCYAGGVALNSVANWKLLKQGPFKELYIQPAAGDGGGSLGAALALHHIGLQQPRSFVLAHGSYGAAHSREEILKAIEKSGLTFEEITDEDKLVETIGGKIAEGMVIGWFHGRFEWGPRALGNRSILADPRRVEMKDIVNTKIKFREPYRPFAPSVLAEHASEYFEMTGDPWPARFMLYVVPVRSEKQTIVPAITHVDGTARPQMVYESATPRYWKLIKAFAKKTGVPMVMNTSFNLKGEPIVNTPEDALSTFQRSGMDILVLENFIVYRSSGELSQ
ncbi:MAG: carbamoyltransferase [Candidatus Yanofskybacteria bacterium]|nr:carbamoyltransferase [Candidatus Yanofskybacteria bacterium]